MRRHPGQKTMIVYTGFENRPLLFTKPLDIISCTSQEGIVKSFGAIEDALASGHHLAGFFSYEAGYCFEERLNRATDRDFPLLHLGVFGAPEPDKAFLNHKAGCFKLEGLRLNISRSDYEKDIESIRSYIRAGEVYQITYCLKLKFGFQGDPFSLFQTLLQEQPVPYPAYIRSDGLEIISCSPELFLKKRGASIVTKPMKGTWPRHAQPTRDFIHRLRFKRDEKNRAENVMIADLLRNDLGRIGHSVRAPRLFEIARYRKLFQMTSTVTARIDPGIPVYSIFSSLFPSGSVTGAPKIRSMDIIRSLEKEERRIYTGAIGFIAPDRSAFFNIPIRTVLIRNGEAEMGIGGGIVWDSTPEGEWAEGLLKARFLTDILVEKQQALG